MDKLQLLPVLKNILCVPELTRMCKKGSLQCEAIARLTTAFILLSRRSERFSAYETIAAEQIMRGRVQGIEINRNTVSVGGRSVNVQTER